MQSLWTVTFVGSHTATTIKKLQRLLDLQIVNEERERYIWNDEKLERASFLVNHGAIDWNELIAALLYKTSKVAMQWQSSGDAKHELRAVVSAINAASTLLVGLPAGLREISWSVRADQTYQSALLSSASTPRW